MSAATPTTAAPPTAAATSAAHTPAANAPSASLAPTKAPLGVFPEHIVAGQEQKVLVLTDDRVSLSGGDATVKDVHDKTVFAAKGKTVSLHDRKEIFDAGGKHLFTLATRLVSLKTTIDVYDGQYPDKVLASITRTKKHSTEHGDELKVEFKNVVGDGKEEHIFVKGSLMDRAAEITHRDISIGRIAHGFANARFTLKRETYALSVAPGADAALLVAIAMVMNKLDDDIKH